AGQKEVRQSIAELQQEKEQFLHRQGSRWAKLSDEKYEELVNNGRVNQRINGQIGKLEPELGDPNEESRRRRVRKELRKKARDIDVETRERWLAHESQYRRDKE